MLTNIFIVIAIIIAVPIVLDIAFSESHICQTILTHFDWYNRMNGFIERHKTGFCWLIAIICVFAIYPLFFILGYNCYNNKNTTVLNLNETLLQYSINTQITSQILHNDSMFVIRIARLDSVVYDRINNKFQHKPKVVECQYEVTSNNESMFLKIIKGLFIIPTWAEVKSNMNISSNGKKKWIICCMVAGYFGFNQGSKYRADEVSDCNKKISPKEWARFQSSLLDENWWQSITERYPYYINEKGMAAGYMFESGIGISYKFIDGMIKIDDFIENSPAHDAGLLINDRIIAIDGKSCVGEDYDQLSFLTRLRGRNGSTVHLTVLRSGMLLQDVEVLRNVELVPIDSMYLTSKINF